MFRERTLFVVGAGASCELKMPSGAELAARIAAGAKVSFGNFDGAPTGDAGLREALRRHYTPHEINDRLPTLRNIADGIYLAESIDNYIERHRETAFVAEMGKFLIAYFLLKAEASSRLKVYQDSSRELDLPSLQDTWLDPFARTLFAGISSGRVEEIGAEIAIVCFNYDGCIERYLQQAIAKSFHLEPSHADRIVRGIKILRPYGSLGPLPPSPTGYGDGVLPFGATVDNVNLPRVAARIKTYTEQIDDEDLVRDISRAVRDATQIVFLGFGFHPQNIKILTTEGNIPSKHLYYSGYGIPEQSVDAMISRTLPLAGLAPHHMSRYAHFERQGTAHHVMACIAQLCQQLEKSYRAAPIRSAATGRVTENPLSETFLLAFGVNSVTFR